MLYLKILSLLLEKDTDYSLSNTISKDEIKKSIGLDDRSSLTSPRYDLDLDNALEQLEIDKILRKTGFGFFPVTFSSSLSFGDEYSVDLIALREKVDSLEKIKPQLVLIKEVKSKLDKKQKKIKINLEILKEKIENQENETKVHKHIKENRLIPYEIIEHEIRISTQNQCDFLILNEFNEYEIWELKGPDKNLFVGKINDPSKYYQNLKKLRKSTHLVKAIEQALIYKKDLIDHCDDEKSHGLKNHIYNAKLVVVIGSSKELDHQIKIDKLNLERHAMHNLNIITYEMLLRKIENYFKPFID